MKTKTFGARTAVVTAAVLSLLVVFTSCGKKTDNPFDIIGQDCFIDDSVLLFFKDTDQIKGDNPQEDAYEFEDYFEDDVKFHHFTIKDVFYTEKDEIYFLVTGSFGKETRSVYVKASNLCFSYGQKKSFIPAFFDGKDWAYDTLIYSRCYLTKNDGDYDEPVEFSEPYGIFGPAVEYYLNHKSRENIEKLFIYICHSHIYELPKVNYPLTNPICMAINADDTELAEALIETIDSDICSAPSTTDGLTPAMTAALKENEKILEALINKRINLSVRDSNGKTLSDYIVASTNPEIKKFNVSTLNSIEWKEIVKSFTDFYSGEEFECPVIDVEVGFYSEYYIKNTKCILIPGARIMKKDGTMLTLDSHVEGIKILDFQKQYTVSPMGTNDFIVLCTSKDLGEFVVLGEHLALVGNFQSRIKDKKPEVYYVNYHSTDNRNRGWNTMFYIDRSLNLFKPLFNENNSFVETGVFNYNSCFITEFDGDTMILFESSQCSSDEEYDESAYFILPMEEDVSLKLIDHGGPYVSSIHLGPSEENNEVIISYAYNEQYRRMMAMEDFDSDVCAGYSCHYYYDSQEKTFIHDYEQDERLDSTEW